jgi:hypothetical protein
MLVEFSKGPFKLFETFTLSAIAQYLQASQLLLKHATPKAQQAVQPNIPHTFNTTFGFSAEASESFCSSLLSAIKKLPTGHLNDVYREISI